MKSRVGLKLVRVLYFSDLHATRLWLGLSEILWALTLIIPKDGCFSRPTYTLMRDLCPIEEVWGLVWLLSGLMQLYILITGKYHERFAIIFAGFNAFLWWSVVISMYKSVSPIPAAISAEAVMALAASTIYLRTGWVPQGMRRSHADAAY